MAVCGVLDLFTAWEEFWFLGGRNPSIFFRRIFILAGIGKIHGFLLGFLGFAFVRGLDFGFEFFGSVVCGFFLGFSVFLDNVES